MGGGQSRYWEAIESLQPNYDHRQPVYGQWPANPSTDHEDYDREPDSPDYEPEQNSSPPIDFEKPLRQGAVAVILFPVDADEPQLIHVLYDVLLNGADLMEETIYWEYKKRTGISQYIPGDLQMTFVTEQHQSDADARVGDATGARAESQPQHQTESLGRVLEVLHPWYDHDLLESGTPPPNQCIAHLIQRRSQEQHHSRTEHGGRRGRRRKRRGRGGRGQGQGRELEGGGEQARGSGPHTPTRSAGSSSGSGCNTECPWYGNVLVTRVLRVTTACTGSSEIAEDFDDVQLEEDLAPMISFFRSFATVPHGDLQVIRSPEKNLAFRRIFGPGLRFWKHDLCRLPTEPAPIQVINRVRY